MCDKNDRCKNDGENVCGRRENVWECVKRDKIGRIWKEWERRECSEREKCGSQRKRGNLRESGCERGRGMLRVWEEKEMEKIYRGISVRDSW